MSNVIVKGWDWLETEIHKALSFAHLTNTTQDFPVAAKAAVSAVLLITRGTTLGSPPSRLIRCDRGDGGK